MSGEGKEHEDSNIQGERSDIITMHVPLTPQTQHMIDRQHIKLMKDGVMLINTSRSRMMNMHAVIYNLAIKDW